MSSRYPEILLFLALGSIFYEDDGHDIGRNFYINKVRGIWQLDTKKKNTSVKIKLNYEAQKCFFSAPIIWHTQYAVSLCAVTKFSNLSGRGSGKEEERQSRAID